MKTSNHVRASLFAIVLCSGIGAVAAAHAATIYVNENGSHFQVYKGDSTWSITSSAIHSPVGMAIQPLGDLVFSNRELDSKSGSIVTLPAGKGELAAKYIIKCKNFTPWGVTLDADSNIWMTNYETNEVRQYAANANGCPAPLSSISGPHTSLDDPEIAAVDHQGRIVVANYLKGIVIFAPGAHGDASPIVTMTNSHLINAHLEGMVIDRQNNIWVTSYADGTVMEFAPDANGTAAPKREIKGKETQLSVPIGIAIDRKTGEIYVADYGTRAVLVFAADANGNVAPIRRFASITTWH